MTDTKEILQKIAALRTRLNGPAEPTAPNPIRALEEKAARGAHHNALLESTLRSADPSPALPPPATLRLTARGVRLLRQGREVLQSLRQIADEAAFQELGDKDAPAEWHREGVAMIEVILRTVQAMPTSVSAQLRMCDGLEVVLAEVQNRVDCLEDHLHRHKRKSDRIDELADYLRALAAKRSVSLTPLQGLADVILEEARSGQPLRFLYASPVDPSRFAASHGLTVAQVVARLIQDDSAWQGQTQLAVMAALVHDVGMTRVPAEVLLTEGPIDSEQLRLIEKHAIVAEEMLAPLWPGGGWTIEAATYHHERNDGTGYPLGQKEIHLAPFVQLLAVCDVYAALCTPRPHRPAFDTRTALTETLLLAERDHLHKPSAERLLLLSFYPVGSVVELNDGAVARVIATHPKEAGLTHPDRPIVHLLAGADGRSIEWPIVVDLLAHKDRSIVRGLKAAECQSLWGRRHELTGQ